MNSILVLRAAVSLSMGSRLIKVHIWDVRGGLTPVACVDSGVGTGLVISTKFARDQMLTMTDRQLVWHLRIRLIVGMDKRG
jgi:hypothetical protein